MKRFWLIGLFFLLMACSYTWPTATPTILPGLPGSQKGPGTVPVSPTQVPADLSGFTPTPALTQLPTLSTASGLVAVEHFRIPDFVFLVDPLQWELKPISNYETQEQLNFLRNLLWPSCELRAPHIGGIPSPDRFHYKLLGNHDFVIYNYGGSALYGTSSLVTGEMQFFELYGTNDTGCLAALETLLVKMEEAAVYYGSAAPVSFATATPDPPLEGYQCNSLAPRLRVGDSAYVSADAVWFRSEPRRSEDTQSQLLARYAPYVIEIVDGPVCADDHTFWAVNVYKIGEGEFEQWSGWISEANPTDYLLEAVR